MTWSSEPSGRAVADARRVAARFGLPLYERRRREGLSQPLERFSALLVAGGKGFTLCDAHGALAATPGLALLRLKRLGHGPPEVLARHAGLGPGDVVVDATVGLAADARVVAAVVGPAGRVIGLEASLPLAALVSEGLAVEPRWPSSAPIELVHSTARAWLEAQPARSADVVLFDPMFERPLAASPGFEVLRRHAVYAPLDVATVDAAKRVARRCVLMKAETPAGFPSLGLEPLAPSRNAKVFWGRWSAG